MLSKRSQHEPGRVFLEAVFGDFGGQGQTEPANRHSPDPFGPAAKDGGDAGLLPARGGAGAGPGGSDLLGGVLKRNNWGLSLISNNF